MNQTVSIPFFDSFGLPCGTTTRQFPLKITHSQQLLEKKNAESVQKFLNLTPRGWAQAGQIHGSAVAVLEKNPKPSSEITLLPDTDGLITQKPGHLLSIVTADCLPVFFYLEGESAVGLVHAGWRGTMRQIVRNAVCFFERFSKNAPSELYAAFGTSIGPCCYEVGPELEPFFPKKLQKRGDHFYLDLVEENRQQLLEAGLLPKKIGPAGPCGSCRLDQFYSYRREGVRAYRMLSWIALPGGV